MAVIQNNMSDTNKMSNGAKNVTIYSTPTCHFCQMAKEFFKEKGIEYTNYDVSTDAAKRQEMIEKSGQMGVPVIFVDSEMTIGFDQARLSQLLGI
jgi:glutaredoxin 3